MSKSVGIAIAAATIGYICGRASATKKYRDWQKENQFYCWRPNKTPERPGDYPQVFVIDKRGVKE